MWTSVLGKGLDSVAGPEFVRERLALCGKTLFLVSFGFYLFLFASLTLLGGAPVRSVLLGPVGLGHLAGSSVMGGLWLLASRPWRSLGELGALDALSVVPACGFLAGMTVEDDRQTLQVLLAITVTVAGPSRFMMRSQLNRQEGGHVAAVARGGRSLRAPEVTTRSPLDRGVPEG